MDELQPIPAFRQVPRTGVIYCTTEAARRGYKPSDPTWSNLGQGMPETGDLPGAPPRVKQMTIDVDDQEYAPVPGLWELREAVASHYNRMYRKGLPSQYSAENVSICGGGRAALTRAAAALGSVNLGHFLPDYTAYEELLDVFKAFTAIPIALDGDRGYAFSSRRICAARSRARPLRALDVEPVQPDRQAGAGRGDGPLGPRGARAGVRAPGRRVLFALHLDGAPRAAAHRERRPLRRGCEQGSGRALRRAHQELALPRLALLVDDRAQAGDRRGRVGGRLLDGGGSKPLQRAAIPLLEDAYTIAETQATHAVFREKRQRTLDALERIGIRADRVPDGTFYVWGNVANLPAPLNDGMGFFRAALERKVITVPGEFFDVNPGKRRSRRASRFRSYVRFSVRAQQGQSLEHQALARIEEMVLAAARGPQRLARDRSGPRLTETTRSRNNWWASTTAGSRARSRFGLFLAALLNFDRVHRPAGTTPCSAQTVGCLVADTKFLKLLCFYTRRQLGRKKLQGMLRTNGPSWLLAHASLPSLMRRLQSVLASAPLEARCAGCSRHRRSAARAP